MLIGLLILVLILFFVWSAIDERERATQSREEELALYDAAPRDPSDSIAYRIAAETYLARLIARR